MLLNDRVVVIAGAGPGLGTALAERLVAHGARVVITARSAVRLADLRSRLGDSAVDVAADLAESGGAERVVATACDAFGRIDGVVYNAAVFPANDPISRASAGDIDQALGVNVGAPIQLVRAAATAMGAGGAFVFIGSAVVRHPKPGFGVYNIGKHALWGLARSLALELGPAGIRVNTIAAGKIDGDRLQAYLSKLAQQRDTTLEQIRKEYVSRIALGRIPAPEDYADATAFLLSDLSRSITGHTLDVNGGEYYD